MQILNLKNKLKGVALLITTVIAYDLGDKIINYRPNLAEQKAQEARYAPATATQMKTDKLDILNDKQDQLLAGVNKANELLKDLPNMHMHKNTIMKNVEEASNNLDEAQTIGKGIFDYIKDKNVFDNANQEILIQKLQALLGKVNQVEDSLNKIKEIVENDDGSSNFINSNFNLDLLYGYLDSLSILQESALFNLAVFVSLILILINIFAALLGNEILNYFNIENKFPSISGFLKLRAKFQKYYIIWNLLLLSILLIGAILINILIFVNC